MTPSPGASDSFCIRAGHSVMIIIRLYVFSEILDTVMS